MNIDHYTQSEPLLNTMDDLIIGRGEPAGKAVYTNRNFKMREVVIQYHHLILKKSMKST